MARKVRILLEFCLMAGCLSLALAIHDSRWSSFYLGLCYVMTAMMGAEALVIIVPKLPRAVRWLFAVRFRPARISVGMVLTGICAFWWNLSGGTGIAVFVTFLTSCWPLMEVIIWMCSYDLYPATAPEPELVAVAAYEPEPPGQPENTDGLKVFEDFINNLDI